MKIYVVEIDEKTLDKLEDTFGLMSGLYTMINEGMTNETYTYMIEITRPDLVLFTVQVKEDYITLEASNDHEITTVELKKKDVLNVNVIF